MTDRTSWLAERRTGIGGSDAAAILGLNEWESPYSVWADKLGLLPEREDSEAMRQGRDLEEYVAQRFSERSGKRVRRVNRMLRHPEHSFMIANVDRDIVGEKSGLECKTTSVMNLSKYKGGEFPVHYYCQCVHYMTVLGYDRWYLAVLVLNSKFMVFQMTRVENDAVPEWCDGSVYIEQGEIDSLIEAEQGFWQLVESEIPPEIDGSGATKEALKYVHPTDEDRPPVPMFGMEDTIDRLNFWKAQKKDAESQIKLHDNKLRAALGGATTGLLNGYEVVLQTISKQPYMVRPEPYTQLRIKETRQ